MDLLSKFDAVTAEPDGQITPQDKAFCAAHQAAYDAAREAMRELDRTWAGILAQQEKALQGTGSSDTTYLHSDHLDLSSNQIERHITSLHSRFIHELVGYFNRAYHVTVSAEGIKNALLPPKPDRYARDESAVRAYQKEIQALALQTGQVMAQITARLDGRSLSEQALHELKMNCHRAAWNLYRGEPQYVQSKNVIRFSYGCSYESGYSSGWELSDSLKSILRGVAHYETGSFSATPYSLSNLLGYNRFESDLIVFPGCHKAVKLRMFKNRRVDLAFAETHFAQEFAEDYLGTVC